MCSNFASCNFSFPTTEETHSHFWALVTSQTGRAPSSLTAHPSTRLLVFAMATMKLSFCRVYRYIARSSWSFISRNFEWERSQALAFTHAMTCDVKHKTKLGAEFVPQGVPDTHQGISGGTRRPFARHTKRRPLHCRLQWSSAAESHARIHYWRHHPCKKNIEARRSFHSQHSHKCCGIIAPLSCCNRCGLDEHDISKHKGIRKNTCVSNSKEIWSQLKNNGLLRNSNKTDCDFFSLLL